MKLEKEQKKELLLIFAGALLLLAAVFSPLTGWLRFAAFLVPYLVCGFAPLCEMWESIREGHIFSEEFLMSAATVGALAIGEYPEAVLVMLLFRIGEFLEELALDRSRESIDALSELSRKTVRVIRADTESEVMPDEIAAEDVLALPTGEMLMADGVTTVHAIFDTSAVTGESLPLECEAGTKVYAGYVNTGAYTTVRAEKAYADSTLSRIRRITEEAAKEKASTESFISRFSSVYTPIVVIGAVLLAIVPPLLSGDFGGTIRQWIYRALLFLVVSCPCALVISVPLGFFSGIGAASKQGILIKGSRFVEALEKADIVATDKTGTLTEGRFSVVGTVCGDGMTESDLLSLASAVEAGSSHPVARAIAQAAQSSMPASHVSEFPGEGICAEVGGKTVGCGNDRLVRRLRASMPEIPSDYPNATTVHVVGDGKYLGTVFVSDRLKKETPAAVKELRACGVRRVIMLSGDRRGTAEAIAREAGLDGVCAELLPAEKVTAIDRLIREKKKGRTLLYAGDGINDAPSLSRADVGIAMGAIGSDAAIEAADVVLMDDDPRKIASAVRIGRVTMRHVRVNIVFSLAVKLAVLLLGAFGLTGMGAAVFADVGVTLLAVGNAFLVFRRAR